MVVVIVIMAVAIPNGRPFLITRPWDDSGNFCGVDNTNLGLSNNRDPPIELYDFTDLPSLSFLCPAPSRSASRNARPRRARCSTTRF
jgi:hypothetical protein